MRQRHQLFKAISPVIEEETSSPSLNLALTTSAILAFKPGEVMALLCCNNVELAAMMEEPVACGFKEATEDKRLFWYDSKEAWFKLWNKPDWISLREVGAPVGKME
ncbi:hypothetical protein WICPIJ_004397 [Wickerhamomyces pijperi]|uniref:Uncharacterized protein n=1 Tax=Wickerhamomyces pijperi TaxID=599730 RepID=A0A9P8Q5Z1_WICPI|nr:hypothetical protein WICPIJ_004397 [Wickerhamomyces pijperi]